MATASGLERLFERHFLEYSSYVIRDRAIPELDDGLKPVQRRILHSLYEMDDGKYHKVANIVGNTMKFHPHGDASIFQALVTLANKGFLIDRQGNYGNLHTGDPPSAARYIEARLSPLARETIFNDDLTEYVESYDARNKEPRCLPARIPVLLMHGAEGIAVGMSTRILSHNFVELLEAQIAILEEKPFQILPDFPQAGLADVREYEDGNGKVRARARIEQKDDKRLVITELAHGTTTESVIQSIEQAVRQGKLKISSIDDYTSDKVEIEISFQRGFAAERAIPALYKFTECEVSLSVNLIVIRDANPVQMTVSNVLRHNTLKLRRDLERELRIELGKLEDRAHAMTLERIFIENRLYKAIEEVSESFQKVLETVTASFKPFRAEILREVSREDAERLVKIPIRRISRFDIERHRKEMEEIKKRTAQVGKDLRQMTRFTIDTLRRILETHGKNHPRRTEITTFDQVSAAMVDLPEVKVSYDREVGYVGTAVRGDKSLMVSPGAKILTISKDGSYRALGIADKTFVGKNLLFFGIHDPKQEFFLVYQEKESRLSFAKRFRIERFIADRDYTPLPEGSTVQYFTTQVQPPRVEVVYAKKPRMKVRSEEYDFAQLATKGVNARGNRISGKEVDKVKKLRD